MNFFNLNPDVILHCAELNGFQPTGRIQQLNSYENRVFDLSLEDQSQIIAKFYRPFRWSQETLIDEHQFELELKSEGLSVAAPLMLKNKSTVDQYEGMYYAFFEKVRGRLIQEFLLKDFEKIGQWIAKLHNIGESKVAEHRPFLGPSRDNKWALLDQMYDHVAVEVRSQYFEACEYLFQRLDEELDQVKYLRIHGDLHRGNILETPDQDLVVVDFDDFLNGPAVQDFWMLLPNQDIEKSPELEKLMAGYEKLRHFPHADLKLIPLLRSYRIITYAGWILNRWTDPSFKQIFPQFNTYNYWLEETESLDKIARFI